MFYAISAAAVAFYAVAGLLLWRRLRTRATAEAKSLPLACGLAGTILHAAIVYNNIFTADGLNFGFTNAVSLVMAFVAGLLVLTAWSRPVENLGIVILPLAALALVLATILPTTHRLSENQDPGLAAHILLSILAYGMLTMATLQAVVLAIQDKHLHNRHPGGLIRALPPLETMENILFQMLGAGFLLQSLSLLSGFIYLDDLFAQHLVHKTVLSLIAWAVFAVLLWGRWRYGWRGRTAIRWTVSGFIVLLLAYFGSKYVLEILLGR